MGLDFRGAALGIGTQHLAAAGGKVADDVAHAFVRHGNGEQDDGFQQHGFEGFHGFFEGQGPRHFEGHFRGVHRVVAAVVDLHAKVHHLAAGQKAARCGFLHAFVNGRDILAGDDAAHDGVFKNIAGAARQAFHLNPAVAELPPAAGLFFVPPLHLALAPHGFAVGHLGRFEHNIHLEAAFGLFYRKLNVQLAHA